MTASFTGQFGTATQLELNPDISGFNTTLSWWLLHGPWHPIWSQFIISVVTLKDIEGVKPATLQFDGATHELLVMALDPGQPPTVHTVEDLQANGVGNRFLTPLDVVHQFTATDDQMIQLAELCAHACVDGILTPSTDDARERFRAEWLTACVKTLAHMRGEEHAP